MLIGKFSEEIETILDRMLASLTIWDKTAMGQYFHPFTLYYPPLPSIFDAIEFYVKYYALCATHSR